MKLYYAVMSTYCQKVLLAIDEKQLQVEKIRVNLMDPDARQSYRQDVYKLGKIPVLVGDDGHFVPESTVICEYLDQTFDSGTRLFPEDPAICREVRFKDRMCDLYLTNPVGTLFFQSLKPEHARDETQIAECHAQLDYLLPRLDSQLGKHPFIAGEHFSVADCAALPAMFYAQTLHPFDEYQHLRAYYARMQSRPSYAAVLEELKPELEAFTS